jgi:hypothetical protein
MGVMQRRSLSSAGNGLSGGEVRFELPFGQAVLVPSDG